MTGIEYKTVATEIKADGDDGVVEGYYSVFGNVDDGYDVTHRGAFEESIRERAGRVKVFMAHDWDRMIAPPPEVLREDEHGLFARYTCVLDSFWGKEAWSLIKAGAMTEGSYGYQAVDYDWDDHYIRHLRKVNLIEVSPVPLGMNPLTAIGAVKSGRSKPDELLMALDACLKSARDQAFLVTLEKGRRDGVLGHLDALADAIRALNAGEPGEKAAVDYASRFAMAERSLALVAA